MSCSCHPEPTDPQRRGLSRRMVVAGSLAAGSALLLPKVAGAQSTEPDPGLEGFDPASGPSTRDYGFLPPRPANEVHTCDIMFPVLPDATLGKATWSDTYLAARSGGRLHEGQDLMGKKMLKLLAVADSTIVELRHDSSGNSLYLRDDKTGWYYCYLHINNDDPGTDNGANQFKYAFTSGMAIGKKVLRGQHVAYLGDSGNAEATGAHCHFEIRMPNAKWYNAAAVNAKYSLNAADPAKLRAKVPNSAFAPLPNASAFAKQQAIDFLGITGSATWNAQSTTDLEGGVVSPDTFIANMLIHDGARKESAPVARLYLGFFPDRIPDYSGVDYWIRKVRAGTPLDAAASQFAGGTDFIRRYGTLSNVDYVKQIYRNLFEREADPSGLDYWTRRLDGGAKRGWVMRQLCESAEFARKTDAKVKVIQVYAAMLKRSPDPSGYSYWAGRITAGAAGLTGLISSIRTGGAYSSRF